MRDSSRNEIESVVNQYKQLIQQDRSYLVPVLGSLSEFELPKDLKNEVFDLASESLDIVDEEDLPTIIKTMLSSLTKGFFFFQKS